MATAARTQTIVLAQPNKRAAPARRSGGFRRRSRGKKSGTSPARAREKHTTQTLAFGGIAAVVFGLIQRKVKLPGIPGVPNSLTYGAGAAAVAVVAKSDKLLKIATGPLFAGLHNIGLRGLGGDTVAGEWDGDSVAGEFDNPESTAGEFDREEVTAGEFDDL